VLETLNEVGQWIAIGFVALLLLGLYRQLSVVLGFAGSSLAAQAGPPVGKRLPADLLGRLRLERQKSTIVFVSQSCRACERLLGEIESGGKDLGQIAILLHEDSQATFRAAVDQIDGAYAVSVNSDEWEQCRVLTTPIICTVDEDGRVVDRRVSHKLPSATENAPEG